MILEQLSNMGAFVSEADYDKTSFEWAPDEDADKVKFEISVKKEPSAADFEFINMTDIGAEDRSVMARTVARLVRVVSVDGEKADEGKLTIETCNKFKPSLLLAFFIAIGEVNKNRGKPKSRRK